MPSLRTFVDRVANERWVRFWTVVAGVAGLLSLFVAVVVAVNSRDGQRASTQSAGAVTQASTTSTTRGAATSIPADTTAPVVSASATPGLPAATEQYLVDGSVFQTSDQLNLTEPVAHVNGEPSPQSVSIYLYFDGERGFATYVLGRHYTRLKATVGIDDSSKSAFKAQVEIVADNRRLLQQTVGKGQAVPVDLDVSGVYSITLSASYRGSGDGTVAFGDARVVGAS